MFNMLKYKGVSSMLPFELPLTLSVLNLTPWYILSYTF